MKDLNGKAVKADNKEEWTEVMKYLRDETEYNFVGVLNYDHYIKEYSPEKYIEILSNRIFLPAKERLHTTTQIVSKEEFMSPNLEDRKAKLLKELQEVEEEIKKEAETIRPEDYVIFENAEGWSFDGTNNGCIGIADKVNEPEYVRQASKKVSYAEGRILNPKSTFRDGTFRVPSYYLGGKWTLRKATKQEITDYLASIPKEKEYTLSSGKKVVIKKDVVEYGSDKVNVSSLDAYLKRIEFLDKIDQYSVSVKTVHIGCDAGVDVDPIELRKIVSIAESLK